MAANLNPTPVRYFIFYNLLYGLAFSLFYFGDMYIGCLWVSGKFKGHGYSNLLLDACIRDSKAKGKKGIAILSSKKEMGFLSDPKYMGYKGFRTAAGYIEKAKRR